MRARRPRRALQLLLLSRIPRAFEWRKVMVVGQEPPVFSYGEAEIAHLSARDKRMAWAIERIGPVERAVIPDLYEALVNSIVGQQISTKAHRTIWARMLDRFETITPEAVAACSDEELQSFGTTFRKIAYIRAITERVLDGSLDLHAFAGKPDAEVLDELVKLPGVGRWTAEMMLTFSLQRPDVISYGDLAIQRGMRMLYRHRAITPELFARYRRRYAPYATVASLYLWAVAGGALPELSDPVVRTRAAKR